MNKTKKDSLTDVAMPAPMTKIQQKALIARRIKWGRSTISLGTNWFASMLDHAIQTGDMDSLFSSSFSFLERFKSRDADFFHELAKWIRLDGSNLKPRQRWLRKILFRHPHHDDQTEFPTVKELYREIGKTPFLDWDERRLRSDMRRIGARFKNSPKAKK